MGFADIVRDATNLSSIVKLVEEKFQRHDIKRPLDPEKDYVRASGIPSLCAREEVLAAIHKVNRPDDIDAGLNLTFLNGTALHWGVQNVLLGPLGVLYGTWRCDHCGFKYGEHDPLRKDQRVEDWSVPRPSQCANGDCRSTEFTYIEHHFKDNHLRISGHADGFLVMPGLPGMGVLELKSIGQKGAREIQSGPQIGHVVQAHVYMMFTGFKWAKILYWQKSEFGIKILLEHHVTRDEETIQKIQDMAASVWDGIRSDGIAMPDRICANSTCPRAKACKLVDLCFKEQ